MALLTYNQLLTNWAATKTTPVDYFYDASSTYFYGPPDYSTIITPSNVQRVTTANRAAVKGSQTVPGAQAVAPNTPGTNDNYETGGRMFRRGGTEPDRATALRRPEPRRDGSRRIHGHARRDGAGGGVL